MVKLLKTIPVPICGLILALVSLGNLFNEIGLPQLKGLFGGIGMGLMLLFLGKVVFLFKDIKEDLKNPIICSVSPTFTMALMIICTYGVGIPQVTGWLKFIWLGIVIVHLGLMGFFTYYHVWRKEISISDIYPSWFVTYVGIGVIPITAGHFYPVVGTAFLWLALVIYLVLLPIILYRVYIYKKLPEATLPLIAIICAPGSLCLTGYLNQSAAPYLPLVMGLLVLSQLLYLFVLGQLPKLLRLKFYPSYGALTFPMVISATAFTKTVGTIGTTNQFVHYVQMTEIIVATVMVSYVLIRYSHFLYQKITV